MNVPSDHPLAIAHGLFRPDTACDAIAALRGRRDKIARDGFIDLLAEPSTPVKAALLALNALAEDCDDEAATHAIAETIDHASPALRWAAIQILRKRGAEAFVGRLIKRLERDESWMTRREALAALADLGDWAISRAADDPHWRVRLGLLRVLLDWGRDEARRPEIDRRLAARGTASRVQGLRAYLSWRWTGEPPTEFPPFDDLDPGRKLAVWDWDPAVLARSLRQFGETGRRSDMEAMVTLAGHSDEAPRGLAVETLRSWGRPEHLVAALRWLDDPRRSAASAIAALINGLDSHRVQTMLGLIAAIDDPSPAQASWRDLQESEPNENECPTAAVRPADHPQTRTEALTSEQAATLVADPTAETSWRVLTRAARITKTPIRLLEPLTPWRPAAATRIEPAPLSIAHVAPPGARLLGPRGLSVCPLGISGHYGLPVEGFVQAVEAGVNVLFWEPSYATLADFSRRLSVSDRANLHFVAGTFDASSDRVRRDVDRALRSLRLERLTLFVLFWTRAWSRIDDDLRRTLDELRDAGKIAEYGLSTHNRTLALEAIASRWNPVMIRHSAGYRGAEEQIIPTAQASGTSLIAFNSLAYGRLLKPIDRLDIEPPTPADCYRYTLSQPAVRLCFSAPMNLEQLAENLDVLRDFELPDDRRAAMLAFGSAFHREETLFRRLVREL